MILQEANSFPKIHLQTKRSKELTDNRIGLYIHGLPVANSWDPSDWINSEVFDLGVKRMRFAINELDVGMANWSIDEFQITPPQKEFIASLVDNGIINSYVLSFWDKAHHSADWAPNDSRFKTEVEVQRYQNFVRFIVSRVMGRVQYFEIWNEPDVGDLRQRIEVPEYINLVEQAAREIRKEYPEAKIVVSVAGTGDPRSRDYLYQLIQSDKLMPLVDVVSWHPFYDTSPEFESEYYYGYQGFVQYIKNVSSDHGFQGEYWATELTWRSLECDWCTDDLPKFPNIAVAKYYARGIIMNLGMDVTVGLGGMSSTLSYAFPTVQNICTVMDTAKPVNIPVGIESRETNIKIYSFILSNGDGLVALWTDDAAVDYDPGVKANLTFPGASAQRVTGIDVLNGFEQELVTETNNGNLVINGLQVKDYPIILRFESPHFAEISDLETTTSDPRQMPIFPVTIRPRNGEERIPALTPIRVTMRFSTNTEEQGNDFLAAVNVTGKLDGQPLLDLNNYWGEVEPYEGGTAGNYSTQWLYPLGVLSTGTHTLKIQVELNTPITDGYDADQDGQLDEYSGEIYQSTLYIIVY